MCTVCTTVVTMVTRWCLSVDTDLQQHVVNHIKG